MTKPPAQIVREGHETFLRLAAVVAAAEELQWHSAPIPKPRDDTTQRVTGTVSDPTSATALDERRLAVRERVEEALSALEKSTSSASAATRHLTDAVDHWYGSHPDTIFP